MNSMDWSCDYKGTPVRSATNKQTIENKQTRAAHKSKLIGGIEVRLALSCDLQDLSEQGSITAVMPSVNSRFLRFEQCSINIAQNLDQGK